MTPPARDERLVRRRWPVLSGIAALLLAGLLALVIVYREQDKPFGIELEWMRGLVASRDGVLTGIALAFDHIGGGWIGVVVVPVAIVGALLVARRRWAALYYAIAALASVGVVQLVKQLVGRPRPTDILVASDFGSFPSGHSANAALIAVVLGLVFARGWVWAAGAIYTVAMMLSRTYLGAHWISDTIGGLLIGAGVAVIVWAPLARRIDLERAGAQAARS